MQSSTSTPSSSSTSTCPPAQSRPASPASPSQAPDEIQRQPSAELSASVILISPQPSLSQPSTSSPPSDEETSACHLADASTSYPPAQPNPINTPNPPNNRPDNTQAIRQTIAPDLNVALTFLLLLFSHLGLLTARYPPIRRRERVAYTQTWRNRARATKRAVKGVREEAGEVVHRAAAISMGDVQLVTESAQARLPHVFQILHTVRERLLKLYETLPPLPLPLPRGEDAEGGGEGREGEGELSQGVREMNRGVREMLARCLELSIGGVERVEEEVVALRILARRYAPSLSDLLTNALHSLRQNMPSLSVPIPVRAKLLPTAFHSHSTSPPASAAQQALPIDPPPRTNPDWGIRTLLLPSLEPGDRRRYAPTVTILSGAGWGEEGVGGVLGGVMPGLEAIRAGGGRGRGCGVEVGVGE